MTVELLAAWTQLERLWIAIQRDFGDATREGDLEEAVAAIGRCLRQAAEALDGDDHDVQSRELHLGVSEAHQRWFLLERCLVALVETGSIDHDTCAPDGRNVELWRSHATAELDAAGHAVRLRTRSRITQLRRRIDQLGFAVTAPAVRDADRTVPDLESVSGR